MCTYIVMVLPCSHQWVVGLKWD